MFFMIMYLLLIGSSGLTCSNGMRCAYLHGYSLTMYTSIKNGYSLTTYTSTENGYSLTTYTSTEHALPHHVYKYRACPPSPPPNQPEFVPWLPTFSFKVVHFVAHLSLTCIISEES